MTVFTGQPNTAVAAASGSGASWKPQDVKEIIDSIKTLYMMSKGQQDQPIQQDTPMVMHSDPPAAKCKVEAGLENLYALTDNLVNSGQGDTKLSSLLDINTLTIRDAQLFIGKVLGR